MFTATSGSMYEEIENARKKKLRRRKIIKRRIIVIILLVLFVSYLGLLLNDIRRFKNGEHPLITISSSTKEYDDGKVETYVSIGWLFRYYYRETINTSEITPFWSPIKKDKELNRVVIDDDIPEMEDYSVPDNNNKREKVDGVLFFYDKDENLLGTYKCLLSTSDCEVAESLKMTEDSNKRPSGLKMNIINNRYVFIKEYKNRASQAEDHRIYLYDIVAKHIIASYQDVRATIISYDEDNNASGSIDNNRYIVKKNDAWGIDEVDKGKVTNFEEYKYSFISYDENARLYIFKSPAGEWIKDTWVTEKWIVFNAETRTYSNSFKESIDSLYYKNDKIYILAYEEVNYKKRYLLYNQEGENVLVKDGIDDLKVYDNFLAYTNDGYLYIIDYDGVEKLSKIKLYFTDMYTRVKPYTIRILSDSVLIALPQSSDKTHLTNEYYYNLNDFTLIKARENVKETI